MIGDYGKLNHIVPDLPIFAIFLKCLLAADQCLSVLSLNVVATGDVAPGFRATLIDLNDNSKGKDCLIPLLEAHVGTSAGEPVLGVEFVDVEGQVEAFDRLLVLFFHEPV